MEEKYIDAVIRHIQNELPDYEVKKYVANKNNGVQLQGVRIRDKSSTIAPIFYIEGYLERGYTEEECAIGIMEHFESIRHDDYKFDVSQITDFESMKDKICYKIVNREANRELLKDVPYDEVADDLAIVYYLDVGGNATVTIRNGMLDVWEIGEDELYDIAHHNTKHIYSKVEFRNINEVLADEMEKNGSLRELKVQSGFPTMDDSEFKTVIINTLNRECAMPLYVLRAVDSEFGASVILYDDILTKIRDRLGENYIMFPSSIHEVLVMPYSEDFSVYELRDIVKQVNAQEVSEEEQLSDNVYFYNGRELVVLTDDIIPYRYNQNVAMQEAR